MSKLFIRVLVGVQLAVLLCLALVGWFTIHHVTERRLEIVRTYLAGSLSLIEEHLAGTTGAERAARLAGLRARLAVPVELVANPPAGLDRALASHGAAMIESFPGPVYYQTLPGSPEILAIGPLPRLIAPSLELIVALVLGILLIISVAAVLLAMPLIRDLRAVHAAVERFGRGDFDQRAEVRSSGAIAELASGFNLMADKIARMIAGQRHLFGAVSHELRTPNARIRFALDLMQDAESEDERRRHIQSIDEDLTEVDQLIDEILTYLRFDTDAPPLTRERFDAYAAAVALAERASSLARGVAHGLARGQDRPMDIEVIGKPVEVYANSKYFRRAIENLLINAVRHAQSRIRVTVEQVPAGGVRVQVADDGPGVPEDARARIFEPFASLDTSRTKNRNLGGTGLGLAIVTRILAWHGGKVEVGDAELGGAQFTTLWP